MILSKNDRVILINQYEILKRLDPDNSDHYEELLEVLRNGYEIFYSMIDEWVSDGMSLDEGKLVLEILDFYRCVENYKLKNPGDQEIESHPWGYFHGFDGNSEGKQFGFTKFLIEKQNKYAEQLPYGEKTDNYNSHTLTLQRYGPMVDKWNSLGIDNKYELSKDNILEVLNS